MSQPGIETGLPALLFGTSTIYMAVSVHVAVIHGLIQAAQARV
jgi:hypothetical protein